MDRELLVRRVRAAAAAAVAVVLVVLVACTSDDGWSGAADRVEASDVGSAGVDDEPTEDVMTPLIVSALSEPIPVKGTDDRFHVAYELEILNGAPRDATLVRIETVDAATDEVVATIDAEEIQARSLLVGDAPRQPSPIETLPGGRTQIVLMDDTYATRDEVPEVVTHRITATFAPARADQAPYVGAIYPDEVTQEAGTVRLGEGEPLRIGPPLQGAGWVAVNACCEFSQHRGAMLPVGGRINGTERYAIDWIQIEPERAPETLAQGLLPSFRGDPERNEDYLAYGQPLLAVGDGTVVKVVDHYGDATPQHLPPGLGLEELGGNTVIIDLGDGFYAFYAHVKPGSITVSEGDRVRRGDVIGRLGNSGNSTEAHLHFHVMRGLAPLAAINWPFVIDEFDVEGSLSEEGLVPEPAPGPRRDELVLIHDVTSFPVVAD